MTDQELLRRIEVNPEVLVGKPVVKGTRLTVEYILNLLAHGASEEEILGAHDGLVREDIQACLLFASRSLESMDFMPLEGEVPVLATEQYLGERAARGSRRKFEKAMAKVPHRPPLPGDEL